MVIGVLIKVFREILFKIQGFDGNVHVPELESTISFRN